jgi:hypothetical protein
LPKLISGGYRIHPLRGMTNDRINYDFWSCKL